MTLPAAAPIIGAVITIDDVHKRHGRQRTLTGVSFTARPGRVTAVLGPNGAGKSTTLRILCGLTRADRGRATIDGSLYRALDRPLQRVGCLIDGAGAHPSRTGRNHLAWVATAAGIHRSRVPDVLDLVGLGGAGRARIGAYSVGMRKRLGLATALLGDPPVLVLDEPTEGLDPAGIRWMTGLLAAWAAEGRTVLTTGHHLAEMETVADDVVVLAAGRVLADGPIASVVAGHPDLEHAFLALTGAGGDRPGDEPGRDGR